MKHGAIKLVFFSATLLLSVAATGVCSGGELALAGLTDEDIQDAATRRAAAADLRREAEVAQREIEDQQRLEQTIDRCVATVKKDLPYGNLDAYVQDGVLHSYGTYVARSKLSTCIMQSGYPMSPLER